MLGAATGTRRLLGIPNQAASEATLEASILAAKTALGETAFEEAWAQGEQMTWEQAVEYALAEKEAAAYRRAVKVGMVYAGKITGCGASCPFS